jgi:hypothetical protein
VDQYEAFIHAPADEVVNHALDYVFSNDRPILDLLTRESSHLNRNEQSLLIFSCVRGPL